MAKSSHPIRSSEPLAQEPTASPSRLPDALDAYLDKARGSGLPRSERIHLGMPPELFTSSMHPANIPEFAWHAIGAHAAIAFRAGSTRFANDTRDAIAEALDATRRACDGDPRAAELGSDGMDGSPRGEQALAEAAGVHFAVGFLSNMATVAPRAGSDWHEKNMDQAAWDKAFPAQIAQERELGRGLGIFLASAIPADLDFQAGVAMGLASSAGLGGVFRHGTALNAARGAERPGADLIMLGAAILHLATQGAPLTPLIESSTLSPERLETAMANHGAWRRFEQIARDEMASIEAFAEAQTLNASARPSSIAPTKAPSL